MLDGHRSVSGRIEPHVLVVCICVNFNEITVFGLHSSACSLHLVAELIAASILAVDNHIHRVTERSVALSDISAHLKCQHVAHQCLVAIVADECPFLR